MAEVVVGDHEKVLRTPLRTQLLGYAELIAAAGVSLSTIERAWRGPWKDGEPRLTTRCARIRASDTRRRRSSRRFGPKAKPARRTATSPRTLHPAIVLGRIKAGPRPIAGVAAKGGQP